ncbi:MAG: N-acetylmuramoyl-L-alanine amidase family protein [Fusobacteriaceae bacterium]
MKKISINYLLFVFIFVGVSFFSFGNTVKINKISSNKNNLEIVFEFSNHSSKPVYTTSYDAQNQLIFLEIKNRALNLKLNEKKYTGKAVESFKGMKMGAGTGFFIKHKPGFTNKISIKNNKIYLEFKPAIKKQFTIAIDAGHGGKDPGAVYFGRREKDIALSVAKLLETELKKDFNVIMIRNNDKFVNLSERPKISNKKKADMFVSIHVNAAKNSKANGVEVFYFSKKSSPYAARIAAYENSFGESFGENVGGISQILGELEYKKYQEVSAKLARGITDSLASGLKMNNRGIHGANFAVLRGLGRPKTVIPGVLVELGFLTNSSDMKKMISLANQKVMAKKMSEQIKKKFY